MEMKGVDSTLGTISAVKKAGDSVEALKGLLSEAIQTENKCLFGLVYKSFKNNSGLKTEDFWKKALESGKIDFIKNASQNNDVLDSLKDIKSLKKVFMDFSSEEKISRAATREFGRFIFDAEACAYSLNLEEDAVIQVNADAPKGDFPDVIINTEGAAYRFSGLTKKEIKEKGLQNCLKERFEKYKKELLVRFQAYKEACNNGNADPETILSTREELRFYYGNEKPENDLGAAEFERADKLVGLCVQFSKTSAAPLLDLLISEEKALAVHNEKTIHIGGLCNQTVVALDNVDSIAVLHHELVHNADHTLHFTQTPVFKALNDYVDMKFMASMLLGTKNDNDYWKKMESKLSSYRKECYVNEVPAYIASFSYEDGPKPKDINAVLDFINVYTKAHLAGNKKEEERLAVALQTDDVIAKIEPLDYLQKVANASPYKDRVLTRAGIEGRS